MPKYKVSFEIKKFEVEVEAADKKEAEEKAAVDFDLYLQQNEKDIVKIEEIEEIK